MSAALVESVRRNLCVAVDLREEYGLDLPAILAALTEAEALRAQVAAQRATLLRWANASDAARRASLLLGVRDDAADREYREASDALMRSARNESPTDTAALKAFGERCVEAGWDDYFYEMRAMDAGVPRARQEAAAIVDRVLGVS